MRISLPAHPSMQKVRPTRMWGIRHLSGKKPLARGALHAYVGHSLLDQRRHMGHACAPRVCGAFVTGKVASSDLQVRSTRMWGIRATLWVQ